MGGFGWKGCLGLRKIEFGLGEGSVPTPVLTSQVNESLDIPLFSQIDDKRMRVGRKPVAKAGVPKGIGPSVDGLVGPFAVAAILAAESNHGQTFLRQGSFCLESMCFGGGCC